MLTWERTAEFLTPRLWLGWAAGGALWLGWIISLSLGGGLYDYFGQLACTDHLAFYSAARMIRDGEARDIYSHSTIAQKQIEYVGEKWTGRYEAYRNPPFYALMYMPTAEWNYAASALFWAVISIVAIVIGVFLLCKTLHWRTLLWVFCFYPTFASISYGQNSPLSFLLLAAVYWFMKRFQFTAGDSRYAIKWLFCAGILAGFLAFKPTLLIGFAVWSGFEFRRLWPCLLGAVLSIAVLSFISYAIVPAAWTAFIESLKDNASFDQMDWWKNLTPRAFWLLLLGPSQWVSILSILTAVVGVGWFFHLWRMKKNHLPVVFGGTVILTLWATPHAMVYEWQLLLIPALLWWNESPPVHRSRWLTLNVFMGILSLVGPPLTQLQLQFWPVAVHIPVIGFGFAGWLAGKWLTQSDNPA